MTQPIPDLLSIVLTLHYQPAPDERPLPNWWGRAAHACLLNLVREHNPELSNSLHDEDSLRPFTASTLMGPTLRGQLTPGETYRLRFTSFSPQVSEILFQSARPGGKLSAGNRLELDYLHFDITDCTWDNPEQPWADSSTYQELAASHLVSPQPAPRRLFFQLTSPTSFRSNGRYLLFPEPGLFFGSLMAKWNAFASIAFPPELRQYAEECLGVGRFQLKSRPAAFKPGATRLGAVGEVSYITLNYDRYWMSLLHTLAGFALYCGAGAGASIGMGQCRCLNSAEVSETEEES